jgi:hypothetical protein
MVKNGRIHVSIFRLFLVFIMQIGFVGWFMVFNTTFNNISVISWLPWK